MILVVINDFVILSISFRELIANGCGGGRGCMMVVWMTKSMMVCHTHYTFRPFVHIALSTIPPPSPISLSPSHSDEYRRSF